MNQDRPANWPQYESKASLEGYMKLIIEFVQDRNRKKAEEEKKQNAYDQKSTHQTS